MRERLVRMLCGTRAGVCAAVAFAPLVAASTPEALTHRVEIQGEGPSTVVFESGLGDTLDSWQGVQPQIAAHCARTVSYNRAGYPGSSPPRGARDAATVVNELRQELQNRGVAPPYVLVGHSLGGLYMQYFARHYPDEVAGLVLVDSTHWNQQLLRGSPVGTQARDLQPRDAQSRRGTVMLFMPFIARRELADSAQAGEQVHASPAADGFPTIVLSSTGAFLGETPTMRAQAARLQEDIVTDFPGARHIRVERSGHYIQRDRPDIVVDSVRKLAHCTPHS